MESQSAVEEMKVGTGKLVFKPDLSVCAKGTQGGLVNIRLFIQTKEATLMDHTVFTHFLCKLPAWP